MRYAVCNEMFEGWPHADVCRTVAELGYEGLELAPFTFGPGVSKLGDAERQAIRHEAQNHGLTIVGLHWLLAKTNGLQITAADPSLRARTAEYLIELAACCRDLGGGLMVLGSPAQRQISDGATREQAIAAAADTLRRALPGIAAAGVRLCLEPLARTETDVFNTCAETTEFVDRFGETGLGLHLDVKAMSAEDISVGDLILRYGSRASHFHANDANRRGPGFGETDFVPIMRALRRSGYGGWVSVEVFDFTPDPVTIARDSLQYLKRCEAAACAT
jgi:sugar phosphate isomerase/epimerase